MAESDSFAAGASQGAAGGEEPPRPGAPAFKDRKVGLIVFGVVQLLMALGFLAIAGMQLLMLFAGEALGAESGATPGIFAATAVLYALFAAGTAWLGIGSIQCRRWARALTLVFAWLGLAIGIVAMVFMIVIFPSMTATMKSEIGDVPEAAAGVAVALGCMFGALAFFYIVLPGVFVLFYRSRHVEATCRHYDATERWTDRIPLPVLAGGILLLSMATIVFAPLMGVPMPLFGSLLTGVSAWVYALVTAGLAVILLRGFFRLERWAWLGTILLMGLAGLSAYVSFAGDGLIRTYEHMGVPPEQVEEMHAMGILSSVPWMMAVSLVAMLAFYVWLGRYFGDAETA